VTDGDAVESVPADAVRLELARLLSAPSLRYSERLSRFLKYVVEQQLAGNGSQIKESVLAIEIFDREPSYDSRVDSLVRVEARRLRDKLDKYYAGEGREDPVIIALPKGSYAPTFAARQAPASTEPITSEIESSASGPRQFSAKAVIAIAFGIVLPIVALNLWFGLKPAPSSSPLRRLTSDSGLTYEPALSRDGKLVAYSSDRGGGGDQDIWLQQVSGGQPVRLTDNPADDVEPSFSPDGTTIAYRAEGEADGVYLVPALGGKSTLLAPGGYRPRFSPDGVSIVYWTGERLFRSAKIFVISSAGGSPVQFQPEFQYAAFPIWSPDGRFLAFVGSKGHSVREESNTDDWDWWVAPVSGGPAVRTLARKVFERQNLLAPESGRSHHRIVPDCWTASGSLLFAARVGDQTNVWRLSISTSSWQIRGVAEQVTFGAGREDHPSMSADGTLVFSVLTHKSDVWGLPIHAQTGEPSGPMIRLTSGQGSYMRPVVSRDGSRLAFLTNRAGSQDVWVKDLKTNLESELTATREEKVSPILSPDGSHVAFGHPPPNREAIFVVPFGGGKSAQVCEDCGEPRAWYPDSSRLLYQRLSDKGDSLIGVLSPAGRPTPLLQSSESALFSPSVSQDGKWLALLVRTPPNDHRVTVVPLRNGAAAPKQEWISVTEPGPWVNKPRWSPNGNLLYYVSDQDGFACIWARRLDPVTKNPVGEPQAVVHFHSGHNSLDTAYGMELSVADNKLVFNLGEGSGNIWLAPSARR